MIRFLINGRAGSIKDEDARDRLTHLIHSLVDDADIVFMDGESDVTGLARAAAEEGSRIVVAGGGDGTISSVAAALAGSSTPLGVLPLGTLNHFAKDLGIPLEIESAIEVLTAGNLASVDYAQVNDRIFLNNSGLGLYPSIVRLRELKQRDGLAKWPAAIWATLKALAHYERLGIKVSIEDQEVLRRTSAVFVGNNEYLFDGVRLPARETLDQGQLCIYIPRAQGRYRLIWFSIRALLGQVRPGEDFDAFRTSECWIDARHRRLRISLDGEVTILKPPLHYAIHPGALQVVVPRERPA